MANSDSMRKNVIYSLIDKIIHLFFTNDIRIVSYNPLQRGGDGICGLPGESIWKVQVENREFKKCVVIKQVSEGYLPFRLPLHVQFLQFCVEKQMSFMVPVYYTSKDGSFVKKIREGNFTCQQFIQGRNINWKEFKQELRYSALCMLVQLHKNGSDFIKMFKITSSRNILNSGKYKIDNGYIAQRYYVTKDDVQKVLIDRWISELSWKREYKNFSLFFSSCIKSLNKILTSHESYLKKKYHMPPADAFLCIINNWLCHQINKFYDRVGGYDNIHFIKTFIHGDYRYSNIIVDEQNKNTIGIIDFEQARREIRLIDFVEIIPFDSERTVVSMLKYYSDECKRKKWIPLTSYEIRIFYDMLRFRQCCYLRRLLVDENYRNLCNKNRKIMKRVKKNDLPILIWLDKKIDNMDINKFTKKVLKA